MRVLAKEVKENRVNLNAAAEREMLEKSAQEVRLEEERAALERDREDAERKAKKAEIDREKDLGSKMSEAEKLMSWASETINIPTETGDADNKDMADLKGDKNLQLLIDDSELLPQNEGRGRGRQPNRN